MTDPKFETVDDIIERNRTMNFLVSLYGFSYISAKRFSPFNYVLYKDATRREKIGIAKTVTRKSTCSTYSDYSIAVKKVNKLLAVSSKFGVPAFIIVRWADKVGRINLNKADYIVDIGGRNSRKSGIKGKYDKEPMAHYGYEYFKFDNYMDKQEQLAL